MPQLRKDEKRFYIYFRKTSESFEEILIFITDDIRKSDTNYHEVLQGRPMQVCKLCPAQSQPTDQEVRHFKTINNNNNFLYDALIHKVKIYYIVYTTSYKLSGIKIWTVNRTTD